MAKPFQSIAYPLKSSAYSASGSDSIDLSVIPTKIDGRFVHVESIDFNVAATPTLSSGSTGPDAIQKSVARVTLRDGVRTHFDDSFATLRAFEMLERGVIAAEANTASSGDTVTYKRSWNLGAPLMDGAPSDFLMPAAAFKGASIDIVYAALAAITNLTALTQTIQPIARLVLLDEVRLPPMVERRAISVSNEQVFGGQALHLFLGLAKSNAFGTMATGDYTDAQVLGAPVETRSVRLADLERLFHEQMRVGGFSQVHGEPLSAADADPKAPNGTAIANATSILAPLVWCPVDGRISKVWCRSDVNLRVKWSGSQSAAYLLDHKLLPRMGDLGTKYGALMEQGLGLRLGSPRIKTISKGEYSGPIPQYMPVAYNPR